MPKVVAPSPLAPLQLESIEGTSVSIPSSSHAFTHLQFRRFAGCPICDMHLQRFITAASQLQASKIQEVIFFHSTREALLAYNTRLPFPVIADPDKRFYQAFGVEASLQSVLHPRAMWKGFLGILRKRPGLAT